MPIIDTKKAATISTKVRISSDDNIANYLEDKIQAGSGITLLKENTGVNEDIKISSKDSEIDHNSLVNTHNLTTDIDHDTITNHHNLTTDINHNLILNYEVDRHIDHTLISVIGQDGVSGSGTIDNNITLTANESEIDHDQLLNFELDKHIDHTQIAVTGQSGIVGSGTIDENVLLTFDPSLVLHNSFDGLNEDDYKHLTNSQYSGLVEGSETDLHNHDHDTLVNYETNEHIDHTTVTISGQSGITGSGTINESIVLTFDPSLVSHNSLDDLDLAQSGVTYGHIDDTTQSIQGVKTFVEEPVVPTIQFDTNPSIGTFSEGRLFYDADSKTLAAQIDTDVTMQIGRELLAYCYNESISGIANGKAVYQSGANSGYPSISLAVNTDEEKAFVFGLTTTDNIASSDYGQVCLRGLVHDIDTSAWTESTELYLDDTLGELTSVIPTGGEFKARVGRVIVQDASSGSIFVNSRIFTNLDDLGDVTIDSLATGDTLIYDGVGWVNDRPALILASSDFLDQGTSLNYLLHGNPDGNPSWSPIVEDDILLSNNATNNVSVTKHGFTPILTNNPSQYLNGEGNWVSPSGVAFDNGYLLTSFSGKTEVNIVHNFNTYPVVQCLNNFDTQFIPLSVVNNSLNDFTATFAVSTTGSIIASVGSPQPQEIISVSSAYDVLLTDRIIDVTTSGIVITLPTAIGNVGREFIVDNLSDGDIIVSGVLGQTIQSEDVQYIPSDSAMNIYAFSNTGWRIY